MVSTYKLNGVVYAPQHVPTDSCDGCAFKEDSDACEDVHVCAESDGLFMKCFIWVKVDDLQKR